jgi:hypothetical protein
MFSAIGRGARAVGRFWFYPFRLAAQPAIDGGKVLVEQVRGMSAARKSARKDTFATALQRRDADSLPLAELARTMLVTKRVNAAGSLLSVGSALLHLVLVNPLAFVLSCCVGFMFWSLAFRYTLRLFQLRRFMASRQIDEPLPSFEQFKQATPRWPLRVLDLEL